MSTPPSLPSPLASVLDDIERAISARLYYPALVVALTVPEICAALPLRNEVFIKEQHYAGFVDKYTTESELGLSGLNCYRLRGGVVHRANMVGHPKFGATHVIFTIPETGSSLHAFSISTDEKTAVMLDLMMFCRAMIKAAHLWYADHKNHPKVVENLSNLIRYSHNGVAPFFIGRPVVGSGT